MKNKLISLFIVTYFSYAAMWLWLKITPPFRLSESICAAIGSKLEPIAMLTGLEQFWALFSPNVRTDNAYSLVVIAFQNGLLKLYELPRMEKMDIITKSHHEKYRKFFNDNLPKANYLSIRPALARFIARANFKPNNPPTRIAYFLISDPIPPPQVAAPLSINEKYLLHTHIGKYFVYGVSPADF